MCECVYMCACACVCGMHCVPLSPSGFNAAVAGCFFAIETVLQSAASDNAPPLTTAMIILASVLSSTVSNVVLGEEPAFTVPEYELKSAAGEAL